MPAERVEDAFSPLAHVQELPVKEEEQTPAEHEEATVESDHDHKDEEHEEPKETEEHEAAAEAHAQKDALTCCGVAIAVE